MAIYLVRHGQTDWNLEHKIMGRADIELNQNGIRQANAMRDKLADQKFSVILYSPLKRAKQTAEIISKSHIGTPILESPEITERDFGEYEGQQNGPNKDYYGLWNYSLNVDTKGGESLQELEQRVFPFLKTLTNRYKDKHVLLVAHGGIGLIIRQYFKGRPKSGNLLELPPVAHGDVEIL